MACLDSHIAEDPRAFGRWSACAALVLAAHALAVLAVAWHPDSSEFESGAPVVMIELAPIPVAPASPPEELAPGPQQTNPENEQRTHQERQPEQEELQEH
jgi:protein TonB